MKKLLLATALVACFGAAQAQGVQVYGRLHTIMENSKVGTAGSTTQMVQEGSRFGFRGQENLGNGLRANFTIETGFTSDEQTPTQVGSRTMLVGLGNNNFNVSMGRNKHAFVNLLDKYTPSVHPYANMACAIHGNCQGLRVQNTVFVTATPTKQLMATYQHSFSEVAGKPDTKGARIEFDNRVVAASVATFDDGVSNKSTALGVSYNLTKQLQVAAIRSDDTVLGNASNGTSVHVGYNLTDRLYAFAGHGKKTGFQPETDLSLGASYNFSKRTAAHVRYLNQDTGDVTRDRRTLGFGIEHWF